jgi:predicted PurR-regulated permease PerM
MIEKLQQMNIETAKGVQDAIEKSSGSDAIGESLADSVGKSHDDLLDSIQKTQEKIADLIQQSDQYAHKENVRVYRNIQAATDQLLQDQTKTLSNQLDTVKEAVNRPRKIPFAGATFALVLLLFLYEIADSLGLIQMVIRLVTGG